MAELCLGTVQFGMDYGINNAWGQPSEAEVFDILDVAVSQGIQVFDTAAAYGTAEEILGKYIEARRPETFKIVTKLRPGSIEHAECAEKQVYEEVCASLKRLHVPKLYGYLLHNPVHLQNKGVMEAVKNIKKDGLSEHVGVSIYGIGEGEAALKSEIVDFIQMPCNVFDQRGVHTGFFEKAKEQGVTIFTRSAFLQGLLLMDCDKIPPYLEKAEKYLCELKTLLEEYHLDRVSALLNYPANNSYVDYVVIGVDNVRQLREHTEKFGQKLPKGFLKKVEDIFQNIEEEVILPNLWRE